MRTTHFDAIRDVLRLSENGRGYRDIAFALNMSKTTVVAIINKCRENNISFAQATDENSADIMKLIYPWYESQSTAQKPEPVWEDIHQRLTTTRHNLKSLWTEYREGCPAGYSYSQFCQRYSDWRGNIHQLSMPINHEPGDIICVDWAGDTIACVRGHGLKDGMLSAHFFIGVLSFSSYPHVEAFPDEKQYSWILAHRHMYQRFSGSSRLLVPDNCKTAISRSNLWDPDKNPVYKEMSDYYNTAVVPARVRRARDKSHAEESVRYYETWIIQKAEDRVKRYGAFSSFVDLNQFIGEELQKLVMEPFQKRPGSRHSVFMKIERPALRPIPVKPFDIMERKKFTVPNNYHVPYRDHYYSVSHVLYKKEVFLVAGMESLKIFDGNGVLVASHLLSDDPIRRYVTQDGHMPRNHEAYQRYRWQDGAYYRAQADKIGDGCHQFIDDLLKRDKYEETAYKSCQGVLSAANNANIGPARVEMACSKCIMIGSVSYGSFKSILDRGLETADVQPPDMAAPAHSNLRNPCEFK
jgi:transposase